MIPMNQDPNKAHVLYLLSLLFINSLSSHFLAIDLLSKCVL